MVKGEVIPLTQKRGLATDMALLGNAGFVAQILTSLCLGQVTTLIGSSFTILYSAALFSSLAAFLANFVLYI